MKGEFHGVPYRVRHRNIRYPRLEFRTGTLEVIVPPGRDVSALLQRHRTWILRRHREILQAREEARNLPLVERDEETWKHLLLEMVREAEDAFRVYAVRFQIRTMKTRWASCSRRGTLTFNRLTRWLPDALLRYLAHHEVVHLRHPHHRRVFWDTLRRTQLDAEAMERRLLAYWFRLVGSAPYHTFH